MASSHTAPFHAVGSAIEYSADYRLPLNQECPHEHICLAAWEGSSALQGTQTRTSLESSLERLKCGTT